ncbi:MAG TPA: hypothetical protein IAB44_13915 [Candidatus Limivivens intestinipullorum]|uniref:Uncharacterized protein n=1 Tax=Candidatus Limivivens intestinipullorum TaxID=2840858 RepID=A0A9D1EUT2_9FIRM|nr:hypothetical protein [Candidatus Limivivens intestinipullorum]
MIRKYPNLCKPITLGRVTFRSRMFSAPMSGAEITPECTIGPKSTAFYELRRCLWQGAAWAAWKRLSRRQREAIR